MSAISDTLDIIDRATERTLRTKDILTPSVRAKLASYREAAANKAAAERTAKNSAMRYKANRPKWMKHLRALRLQLVELKHGNST